MHSLNPPPQLRILILQQSLPTASGVKQESSKSVMDNRDPWGVQGMLKVPTFGGSPQAQASASLIPLL